MLPLAYFGIESSGLNLVIDLLILFGLAENVVDALQGRGFSLSTDVRGLEGTIDQAQRLWTRLPGLDQLLADTVDRLRQRFA